MSWQDFERFIAGKIQEHYQQLETEDERRTFCREIGLADRELRDTYRSNADYTLPRIGEAYVLKYHLGRADNLYFALNYVNRKRALPDNLRVLDVGSGTGGSTMATVLWAAQNRSASLANLEVYGIEPMSKMREIADNLRQPFLRNIEQSANLTGGSLNHKITHAQSADSLEKLADLQTEQRFNLIIFSFVFHIQDEAEREVTVRQVLKVSELLSSGGVLLFLTPNKPPAKLQFQQLISSALNNTNTVTKLDTNIGTGKHLRYASNKRPTSVIELRRYINNECRRLAVEPAFGEDPQWDDPYYGFYCTLDAFIKN